MKILAPLPIAAGQRVILRLGRKHRQWERIHDSHKFRWIEGVVDWVAHDNKQMFEIRVSRKYCTVTKGLFDRSDFYIRVEYEHIDGFNFRDCIVIRRVSA